MQQDALEDLHVAPLYLRDLESYLVRFCQHMNSLESRVRESGLLLKNVVQGVTHNYSTMEQGIAYIWQNLYGFVPQVEAQFQAISQS